MLGMEQSQTSKELLKTFVGGLPYHCYEEELRQFLEQFGSIEQIYVSKDSEGQHKGFAFVSFSRIYPTHNLFGEHGFKNKTIEVKLNLLNHLFVPSLPRFVSGEDLRQAIESLGYPVAKVMVGSGMNGIPAGTASVKLVDDFHLNDLGQIGKLIIKGAPVKMEARTNKYLAAKAPSIQNSSRKKHNKKSAHLFSSEKKVKNYLQDFSQNNCSNTLFYEHDMFTNTFMRSATRPSESEFSTGEMQELGEFSNGASGKKELATSFTGVNKDFMLNLSQAESLELSNVECNPTTVSNDESEMALGPMIRHHSECLTDHDFDHRSMPRRLNSFSSSFFKGPVSKNRSSSAIVTPEITIGFYTYPGRD